MNGLTKRFSLVALMLLGASGSLGCEYLASIDRSKIPGAGGYGGTSTGGGGTGGSVVCGDGVVSEGEACDDGNSEGGDGCSASCAVESGYACDDGAPSACTAICGDGLIVGAEACDDGDTSDGDGCSAACTIETGYACVGQPSMCTPGCGDGIIAGAEACDDGNSAASDGCDAACQVEQGYLCGGAPSLCAPVCGDGLPVGYEECDDGNGAAGDGCDTGCETEPGYLCQGSPSACAPICGDGLVTGSEACDDGNTAAGDGCDATCVKEAGWACDGAPSLCAPVCGDGILAGAEACDDGNTAASDGCDASCVKEAGWACAGAPSACTAICGDGLLVGAEACDDGNTAAGDGCNATCVKESGWVCAGAPSVCHTVCGDGIVTGSEACDDGNTAAGDGCDATCVKESGWACAGAPSACTAICGDGLLVGAEACDDGNTAAGDGCGATCVKESGWVCAGAPSVCHTVCGDGIVAGAEACDDGNTTAGDGCNATCAKESGWVCTGAPSACSTVCGDGIKAGAEACDDGNAVNLDGCNTSCKIDVFDESEPNGTRATADGPFAYPVLIHGAVQPFADADWFAVQLPATADLHLETFDQSGAGSCANIDTTVTLFAADGTTVLATDDDGGINRCSRLDGAGSRAVRHLPAGTYYVKVGGYADYAPIPAYTLVITYDALCGDGQVQGAEQCDGAAGCSATCDRVPSCGDGHVDGAEQCDDGNTKGGDGCGVTCQLEVLAETEPNGTAAQATVAHLPNVLFSGAISPAADVDVYAIQLAAVADLKIETFDAAGPGSCNGIDTVVTLLGTDGTTVLVARDQGGLGNCGAIDPSRRADAGAAHLPAGTYYVKVESHAGATTIAGYQLRVTYAALCGDGVVEGAETCDGGAGCAATCDRVPVCGDGFVDAPETCDDGNAVGGDGCSATCHYELLTEKELNDTPATANGPYATHALIGASISPANDVDYFAVQVTAVSDLRIETFDGDGPGSCDGLDTVATLFAADGTTQLAQADDGGINACSRIDAKTDAGARHLAPGTYYVKIENFTAGGIASAYRLEISFTAVCGDGHVQGAEECDGTANCDASCNRVATCGDGFVDAPETCDDGNTASGDGCSSTCQLESLAEAEPNDTTAQSDASGVQLTGSATVAGAIGAVGDKDVYKVTLAAASVVRLETFDGTGAACAVATTLRLYDASGAQLQSDDNSGMSTCSALALSLPAGTYYAGVEQRGNTATIAAYVLQLRVEADGGVEAEPNDTDDAATAVTGADVFVLGHHASNTDTDFFAITVPPGRSVRAEIIEGSGAETCESLDIDSFLTLYDASGVALATDDDSGRGFCSRIDGTGDTPATAGASKLAGGTYYLAVEAAPFAQSPTDTSGQFDYRLVITIR